MIFNPKSTLRMFLSTILLAFSLSWMPSVGYASPSMQEEPVYIVQQGDTLNTIALRFGVSPDDVAAANNIEDPNALNIGQRLIIPGLEGINGVLTSEVLPFGSSLNGLIRQYQLQHDELALLNRLASPSETIAGIKFIIPINENQTLQTPLASPGPETTLIEIAIQSGLAPWHLVEDNQLQGTWDLLAGETLYSSQIDEDVETPSFPTPITGIALNNLPVIQGETLNISISSSEPVDLSGKFDEHPLHFFTEDDETYYTFHGIHALAEPGPVPVEITANFEDGRTFTFDQLVMLAEGGYGPQWLTNVPEEYLDEAVIAEEDAYLNPIIDQVSPQRHWEGKFQYPVDEPCVDGAFGLRRDYNDGGLFFYHTGMDFPVCALNLNIYAPAAGEVVLAEELVIKGKAILIDHGWGVFSGYWHLEEFNVEVGDFVEAGDLLGLIGNTGRSIGPHLHFEMDITGTPVNPQTWLNQEFPQPVR